MKHIPTKLYLALSAALLLTGCGGGGDGGDRGDGGGQEYLKEVPHERSITVVDENYINYLGEKVVLFGEVDQALDVSGYAWRVVDASAEIDQEIAFSNEAVFTFNPPSAGDYSIELTISYANGASEVFSKRVSIADAQHRLACDLSPAGVIRLTLDHPIDAVSKHKYSKANISIENAQGDVASSEVEVKGRGNSTWTLDKKPYRLKFGKKEANELLGMPHGRNWAMLANHFDGAMLRNAAVSCLAQTVIRDEWVPEYRFSNVYVNDEYRGLYQVYQNPKTEDETLNKGWKKNHVGEDQGFMIELTSGERLGDGDVYFRTARGNFYEVRNDLSEDLSVRAIQINHIKNYVDRVEAALKNPGERLDDLNALVDLKSLVDFVVVHEYSKDRDAFAFSTKFYRLRGEVMHFGPVWDFDLSMGNDNSDIAPFEGLYTIKTPLMAGLSDNTAFRDMLKERYAEVAPKVDYLVDYLVRLNRVLASDIDANYQRWDIPAHTINWGGSSVYIGENHASHMAFLKDWMLGRRDWLANNL